MSPPARRRDANIIGAAALAITERVASASQSQSLEGAPHSSRAALSAMRSFLDGPTVEDLRRVLGLTHSGAVRLVDRLCESGLARRDAGHDGRTRQVRLTLQGERAADRLIAARLDAIDALTRGLSAAQRAALVEALSTMIANLVDTKDGGAWLCRMCDTTACGRPHGRCPAAIAAARRFG